MKKFLQYLSVLCGLFIGILIPTASVNAVTCPDGSVRSSADTYAECSVPEDESGQDLMSRTRVIINVVLGVLGIVSVAMIILGGIMYTTSQGKPDKIKQAKDIILYAIVGLVVALLSFAIVNFVLQEVFS